MLLFWNVQGQHPRLFTNAGSPFWRRYVVGSRRADSGRCAFQRSKHRRPLVYLRGVTSADQNAEFRMFMLPLCCAFIVMTAATRGLNLTLRTIEICYWFARPSSINPAQNRSAVWMSCISPPFGLLDVSTAPALSLGEAVSR